MIVMMGRAKKCDYYFTFYDTECFLPPCLLPYEFLNLDRPPVRGDGAVHAAAHFSAKLYERFGSFQ